MKKIFISMLVLLLSITLVSCNTKENNLNNNDEELDKGAWIENVFTEDAQDLWIYVFTNKIIGQSCWTGGVTNESELEDEDAFETFGDELKKRFKEIDSNIFTVLKNNEVSLKELNRYDYIKDNELKIIAGAYTELLRDEYYDMMQDVEAGKFDTLEYVVDQGEYTLEVWGY